MILSFEYRLKLAYVRNASDSSSSCDLCNTTVEIKDDKSNPVDVVIWAKNGTEYYAEVQGNAFPACKF